MAGRRPTPGSGGMRGRLAPSRGRRGRARLAALGVLAALVAAACDASVASPSPTATRAPDPTATVTRYPVSTRVWYAGAIVTLLRATSTLDDRGGPVEIALTVENPGPDQREFEEPILLSVGTTTVEPTRESTIPPIDPGATVTATFTFELNGIADAHEGKLTIGRAPEHVAVIPLSGTPQPTTFEPRPLKVSGSATAADLRIALKSGELRWDLPDWQEELPETSAALTLVYDVTYAGDFSGGFAFTGGNIALRLPDGKTIVEPRRDGHSQSAELIGARKTKQNLSTRFEIPFGVTGTFMLLVRNGQTTRGIAFQVPE